MIEVRRGQPFFSQGDPADCVFYLHKGRIKITVVSSGGKEATIPLKELASIDVDIQLAGDGEAMVHHDFELGRLTDGAGALRSLTAAELQAVPFKDMAERMMTARASAAIPPSSAATRCSNTSCVGFMMRV